MKKVFRTLMTIVLFLVNVVSFIPVTALGSTDLLDGKEWKSSFVNGASGNFTSTGSDNFIADMSSIGNLEWDATVSMKDISLTAGETYIFAADIKSDKARYKNFISLCTNANTCDGGLFTNYLEDLTANSTVSVRRIFTPSANYSNASLHFGLGKNGYEGTSVLPNSANKIEVSNIQLTKLSDYSWMLNDPDYTSYTYTTINTSDDYAHKNYAYAGVLNINYAQAENKEALGIETIAVATTAGIVAEIDNKYQVYINGELIDPPEAENGWYHIDYDQLDREYNEIWTLSETNNFSILIVRNGEVTTTKTQILADLNTNYRVPNENSSAGVKQIIEDAATAITNATTVAEAQSIYDGLADAILLQQYKDAKADIVSAYNVTGINQVQRDLVIAALDDINAATSISQIDSIVSEFLSAYTLENSKRLAKAEIDELIGDNPSEEILAMANEAKAAIDNAATVAGVNNVLEEVKEAISEKQTLEETRSLAIEKINNSVTNDASSKVKEIAEKAIEEIEAATTKDEINTILEKALKDIKDQYAKDGESKSKSNPNTGDNILKYFIVLIIGACGLLVFNNKKILKRSK